MDEIKCTIAQIFVAYNNLSNSQLNHKFLDRKRLKREEEVILSSSKKHNVFFILVRTYIYTNKNGNYLTI